MLSSSLSDVRQTKVYDISFRVPAIREGPLSASRSLGQKIKLLLTIKSMSTGDNHATNSGCGHKIATHHRKDQ
jgi:hypothetical protein